MPLSFRKLSMIQTAQAIWDMARALTPSLYRAEFRFRRRRGVVKWRYASVCGAHDTAARSNNLVEGTRPTSEVRHARNPGARATHDARAMS
jgi:hypothetical protein